MRALIILILLFFCITQTISANAKDVTVLKNIDKTMHINGGADIPFVDINPQSTLKPALLPSEIRPLSKLTDATRPFSGLWHGQWEGTLDMYLALIDEDENSVIAFYSWGANAITPSPGMRYIRGVVYNDTLLLPGKGVSISFQPQPDGTLFGLFYSPRVQRPSRIILQRFER